MKSNLAIAAVCLAILVVCAAAFSFLYRDIHPLATVHLSIDPDSAGRKAASIVQEIFPNLHPPKRDAQLSKNDELIGEVFAALGQKEGRTALLEGIPGYFWNVRWKRSDAGRVVITSDDRRPEKGDPLALQLEEIQVRLNTSGDLIEYEWSVHDTASTPPTPPDSTRMLADTFLQRHFSYVGGWEFTGEKKTERMHRTDVEYSWSGSLARIGQPAVLKIKASGSRILAAGLTYPGLAGAAGTGGGKVHGIVLGFLSVALGILMIVVAFKRSRAYEMSFRLGVILGIVLALFLGLEIYLNMPDDMGWEMLVSLIFGPLFFGGAFILLWGVAESVAREAWRGKFTALDLLVNGHILHSHVGRSILQGMAIGAAASLVWTLLIWLVRSFVPSLYVPADGDTLMELTRAGAAFTILGQSLTNNAYLFSALLLFLVSLVRFRVRSVLALVVAGALAIGVINRGGVMPLAAGIAVSTIVALVISWGFYKFDVLTSFISLATVSLLMIVPAFFIVGTETCLHTGCLLAGGLAAVAAFGVAGMLTRDRTVDLESITPAFVKHITERERLQRELEIARDVQMSFLPRRDPVIQGVDIASRCAPALEVGGDYYDFIMLGDNRFGVVVGDVSGKGTQAAFYMTLTKGFLKAVTRASESPAEVLTQLNDLFYENVERGTFISMVYGIFDLNRGTVTIARAGHNPPLYKHATQTDVEFIQPSGLALGLEGGPAFAGAIKEFTTDICPGDLFLFYTDGFTEAMNHQKEEYGDERLRRSVQKHAAGAAAEVMNGIFADVRQHAGKAGQHDDMTIVVVKMQAGDTAGLHHDSGSKEPDR